jgi:hypothetical protein
MVSKYKTALRNLKFIINWQHDDKQQTKTTVESLWSFLYFHNTDLNELPKIIRDDDDYDDDDEDSVALGTLKIV